jgi:Uma2 family endonuclease
MVVTNQITVEEFEAMPLEGSWELIDGEMRELSPNAGDSGWIAGQIVYLLESHARSANLGWVFPPDVGFVLFDDRATVRSPDVAFVRRQRLSKPPASFVRLAPDLAVEVLSPSDRRPDALAKVAMYLQAGVRLVWLVDPDRLTITVFRPDDTIEVLNEGDNLDGGDVLPGFSLPVAEIFQSSGG